VFSFQGRRREEEDERGVSGLLIAAVFDTTDEALEHCGDLSGFLDHLAGVGEWFEIEGLLDALADIELGAKLTARAFADAQEPNEISVTVPLRPLGDVRRNRNRRTLHLVFQPEIFRVMRRDTHINSKLTSAFPNFQILKGRGGHGLFSFFLKTEH
jgi:hypothetical protein